MLEVIFEYVTEAVCFLVSESESDATNDNCAEAFKDSPVLAKFSEIMSNLYRGNVYRENTPSG